MEHNMDAPRREVPDYEVQTFFPRRRRFGLCVFVVNEGEKIRKQIDRMQPFTELVDILIADGGSADGSLEEGFLKSHGIRGVLTKTGPGKLSAQMRMAFDFALNDGYDGVIVMDGNNKDHPGGIPGFVRSLEEGWDHIQGSRFIPGGYHENTPLDRRVGIKFLHAPLISWIAGVKYTDTTNGFRAYSRRLLTDPRVHPFRSVFAEYELHYYLAVQAGRLGYRVKEIPVDRRYPASGPVPTKIGHFRGKVKILKTLWAISRRKYDPKD